MQIQDILAFIRRLYSVGLEEKLGLHDSSIGEAEKQRVLACLGHGWVATNGPETRDVEHRLAAYTGAVEVVATNSGTSALHLALLGVGIEAGDLVLTQALSFVATGNAIAYTGAEAVFIDVDEATLCLCPLALENWLASHAVVRGSAAYHRDTGRRIGACLPMHTFGKIGRIEQLLEICSQWYIPVVEDAAEALGSFQNGKHAGSFGKAGILSFNGNKTVTAGAGGAVLVQDKSLAEKLRHWSVQSKMPHAWEYRHDAMGYNYRMPSLNAALLLGQLDRLEDILRNKRETYEAYRRFFQSRDLIDFPPGTNCWLNGLRIRNPELRQQLLEQSNAQGLMTRPLWGLMSDFPMFRSTLHGPLPVSQQLVKEVVNLPSGYRGVKVANGIIISSKEMPPC